METDGSLPCLKKSAIDRYPEQLEFTPCHVIFSYIVLLSSHLRFGLQSGLFPWGFPTNSVHVFLPSMRTPCTAYFFMILCCLYDADVNNLW